jgi:glutaconyl-CoA decarboxylase
MKLKITVQNVDYEVDVEVLEDDHANASAVPAAMHHVAPVVAAPVAPAAAPRAATPPAAAPLPTGDGLTAPVPGTVIEVTCKAGDQVKRGQTLLMIEAMKMETKIASDRDATVKSVQVKAGENIREGQLLVEFA